MTEQALKDALARSNSKAARFFANNTFILNHAQEIVAVKGDDGCLSKSSFAFDINPNAKNLATTLALKNTPAFCARFSEAISGDGQERNRITRLGSSSLLAFLCFNNVSDNNRLMIQWGEDPITRCEFNEVHFECQNPVTAENNSRCSNVDILLIGENMSSSRPIALFLESKFSEYFARSSAYTDISHIYKPDYDMFFNQDWQSLYYRCGKDKSGNPTLELHTRKNTEYCCGIKQMISHYRGLKTLAEHNLSSFAGNAKNRSSVFHFKSGMDVFLGSIVFNFPGRVCDKKAAFASYKELYAEFAAHFPSNECFHIVPELLTYQTVFAKQNTISKYKLAQSVRSMYELS